MNPMTLDKVLTFAETLSPTEQEMLTELLRNRQVENWREDTATEAKKAVKNYRSGKLPAQSADAVIARLRSTLERSSD